MPTPHFNIGFGVGDRFGQDHSYWPTLSRAAATDLIGYDPLLDKWNGPGLNLEQYMALTWKVATWRMTGSWGIITTGRPPGGDHDFTVTINSTVGPNDFILGPSNTEIGIASHYPSFAPHDPREYISDYFDANFRGSGGSLATSSIQNIWNYSDTDGHVASGTGQTPGQFWSIERFLDLTIYDSGSKLFYPYINFAFGSDNPSHTSFLVGFVTRDRTRPLTQHGNFHVDPLVCDPFDVPLYAFTPPGFTTISSATTNITMAATSYFPYRNSQGLPCFNVDTGAQLNDPFA